MLDAAYRDKQRQVLGRGGGGRSSIWGECGWQRRAAATAWPVHGSARLQSLGPALTCGSPRLGCPRPFDRGFSSCRPSQRPASCLFKSLAHLFHSHALLSLGTLHTIPAFSPSRWSCLAAGVDGGGNVTLAPAAQGGARAPVALPMPPPPPAAPAAAAGVGAGPLLGGGDDAEERARRKQVGIQGRPRTLRWVVLC